MLTFINAIILGVIEGVTEFLPISSTAHLILSSKVLNIPQSEFVKTFQIVIQFGAILSVVALYWRSFLNIEVLKRLIAAFIPTGIIGFLAYGFIKQYLFESPGLITTALLLGGIFLIAFETFFKHSETAIEDITKISYKHSVIIGIFQAIAIVPGISRSAATIIGGLSLGLKRKAIVEFSFLLAVPTMLAASAFDILETNANFSAKEFQVLAVGFIVSFIVALLSIKFLLAFIRKRTFISFGIYRIIAAVLFFLLVI
jgi:undecaprenyl-diphosphatase